ncbi:TetR/AcrR family transcriptional regulator [Phytomonospora endophytica]|uniref:AcrR family transcriptional regulator n=1 Tax=Phytomonospora endophytica TaxID=714109 RepID=A0A841FTS1_9ACTN|nr:TetR/AcrR family transcriptional regulator [Phytomonospora endophytica]MBB6039735.1 AcrR family transcriptional regulator [Phytomonospora endophytica]
MSAPTARGGRPREERVDAAILSATRELLVEGGYAGLTVGAVAARAGIGKAAIYRRYETKQEMVFAAAVHGLDLESPPDLGSLRAELEWLTEVIAATLSGPAVAGALGGLLADMSDDAVVSRMRETFVAHQRANVTAVLDRAVARGELTSRPDAAVVHAMLLGPVFAWLFVLREPGDVRGFAPTLARMAAAALSA